MSILSSSSITALHRPERKAVISSSRLSKGLEDLISLKQMVKVVYFGGYVFVGGEAGYTRKGIILQDCERIDE